MGKILWAKKRAAQKRLVLRLNPHPLRQVRQIANDFRTRRKRIVVMWRDPAQKGNASIRRGVEVRHCIAHKQHPTQVQVCPHGDVINDVRFQTRRAMNFCKTPIPSARTDNALQFILGSPGDHEQGQLSAGRLQKGLNAQNGGSRHDLGFDQVRIAPNPLIQILRAQRLVQKCAVVVLNFSHPRDARMIAVMGNALGHHVFAKFAIQEAKGVGFDVRTFNKYAVKIKKNGVEQNAFSPPRRLYVLSQRLVACSSLAFASTHCSPAWVDSFFQKGAFVFSQSIKK